MHTLRGRVILLVDDNLREARPIVQFLRLRGASVLGPVPNADYALEIVKTERSIDYAIVKGRMRERGIHVVADALLLRQVPFVFLCGDGDPQLPPQYAHIPRRTEPLDLLALAEQLMSLDTARFAFPAAQKAG